MLYEVITAAAAAGRRRQRQDDRRSDCVAGGGRQRLPGRRHGADGDPVGAAHPQVHGLARAARCAHRLAARRDRGHGQARGTEGHRLGRIADRDRYARARNNFV